MTATQQSYIKLHIAVLLFGFTAILGDLIALPALVIVWWRVFLASISFFILIKNKSKILELSRSLIAKYMAIGVIVGIHWVCFYGSVKLANASVALVCMATTSLFTSIVEPMIMKRKRSYLEIILGIMMIPAMVLIVNNLRSDMLMGVWVGLLAAALAALFGSFNKKYIDQSDTRTISFIELGAACLFLSLVLPVFFSQDGVAAFWPPGWIDWFYILVLVLLCTTLAYLLALDVLRHLSAFASNLVINLEPIYGILLAIVLLQEHKELDANFYIGGTLIIAIVISYPILKKKYISPE